MGKTSIEWTQFSVNPIRARVKGSTKTKGGYSSGVGHHCVKVSPGCKHCYSSATQPRFGLPVFQDQRKDDAPEVFLDATKLADVLRRKAPTKFFWCDMTDMFGDWVPNEWIAACFGVMAATPQHTHQVLTKRATRMRAWFEWVESGEGHRHRINDAVRTFVPGADHSAVFPTQQHGMVSEPGWPLPSVWLGVSAENQETADERIPGLLSCPAAVRWVSAEPLLGSIDFGEITLPDELAANARMSVAKIDALTEMDDEHVYNRHAKLDWVVVGSESGHGARAMDLSWARRIVDQCLVADVPVFTKQIASEHDRKGGDPAFWPPGEWPRQYPVALTPVHQGEEAT